MPGFNPEKINIHDLTVEEPEKQSELPFDPERDITKQDWKSIDKMLNRLKSINDHEKLADFAMELIILDDKKQVNISEERWKRMEEYLESRREKGKRDDIWEDFARLAAAMKIINPDFDPKIDSEKINMNLFSEMKNEDGSMYVYPAKLLILKILDPDIDFHLTDHDWANMLKDFDGFKKRERWRDLAWTAAGIKIADPTRKIDLGGDFWEGIRDFMSTARKEDALGRDHTDILLEVASVLKLVAAEKIEFTNKGIKITMPDKKFEEKIFQMPEQRNF